MFVREFYFIRQVALHAATVYLPRDAAEKNDGIVQGNIHFALIFFARSSPFSILLLFSILCMRDKIV